MSRLLKLGAKKLIILVVISIIILALTLLPFLPSAVENISYRTIKEQLVAIYDNSGFEDIQGDKVTGWSLTNGSKISRVGVYEGNNAINMTPSIPYMTPQIVYLGKNATTGYLVGGNLVLSLAVKVTKTLVGSKPSNLTVGTIVFHTGPTNTTAFLFIIVLFKEGGNAAEGVTLTKNGVIAYKSLKSSDSWYEYSIQISTMTEVFSEYLSKWKGIEAKPTDNYKVAGLTVLCENLVAYVDKASLYLIEPKWLIMTMRSNSIIPMGVFLSEIKVNGSTPTRFFTKPDFIAPFSTFELYTFVPYAPPNGSKNLVTIKFGTGQAIQFTFIEETERIRLTF